MKKYEGYMKEIWRKYKDKIKLRDALYCDRELFTGETYKWLEEDQDLTNFSMFLS